MESIPSPSKRYLLLTLPLALFLVLTPIFSHVLGATLNLKATWTPNTETDMAGYNLYRTDGTRIKINSTLISHPPTLPYLFSITVTDGSQGKATFVLTAMDKEGNESADSNLCASNYDLSKITFSGYIRDSSNVGISGVIMAGFPNNPKTDANGYYSVFVSNGWSGTVKPSKSGGYTFNPPSKSYSGVTSDQTGQNYTAILTEVISTPKVPSGPSTMYTGTSYKFSTGGSTSNLGFSYPVEYQFDWGDGTFSSWGPYSQSHLWTLQGTYSVKAQARSKRDPSHVSAWSNASSISVQAKPFIQVTSPNGGENLLVGNPYTITWNSGYLSPGGTLYLFYWYDGAWHPITMLAPGASSFTWTIPRIPEKVTSPKPSGLALPASLWIGNWVNETWECYDKNNYKFWILYDGWVCTISGGDHGGATLLFDEGVFDGYGISLELGMFGIQGNYSMDAKGLMSGTYTVYDFDNPAMVLYSGNFTGSVSSSLNVLRLALSDVNGKPVFNMSGQRLLNDPVIPMNWTGTISGSAGTLDSLSIVPYQLGTNVYSHAFEFSGSGSMTGSGSINILGHFYFTSAKTSYSGTNVYGMYQFTGAVIEDGTFTGNLNPSSGKISFTMTNADGNKFPLVGQKTSP